MNNNQNKSKLLLSVIERIPLFLFVVFLLLQSIHIIAQDTEEKLNNILSKMSLEELMEVKVFTGTFTEMKRSDIPVSFTVITKEDIAVSSARNLLDLIEIYVPSATFVNHWLGPRIGIRGVSGDMNSSYMLIVNGVRMNDAYMGQPLTEMLNKDLGDIETIEIIRGPGSVTYGPGAIGGVINITTKNAVSSEGLTISTEWNLGYRYGIGSASYGYNTENVKAFIRGSYTLSKGQKNPKFFYVDRAHGYGYGFMSPEWGNKGLGTPAPNFYENYWNKPETKLQLDVEFFNEFRLWTRYTSSNFTKQQQKSETADGPDFPGLFYKQFTAVFENKHHFSQFVTLKSSLGYSSQSHRDISFYQGTNKPSDHITQRNYSFSESDLFVKSQLNFDLNEKYRFAVGGEYVYKSYGPEWGMDDNSFILGFQAPIRFAVYDTTSGFYQQYGSNFCTLIEDQVRTNFVSGFFEANIDLTNKNTILISGRADKHKYSKWAISPRLAWIYKLNKKNVIKIIYQQSVRLPTFRDLYSEYIISGTSSDPEILRGFEVIYGRMQNKNLNFNFSGYYNIIDQIAWLPTNKSGLVGAFKLAGFDAEIKYSNTNFNFSGSYSFINQLNWTPEVELEAYVDVNLATGSENIDKIYISDYGQNRINNLPVHSIKFYYNQKLPYNLNLHFDCRMSLDYQQEDLLMNFKDVHDNYGAQESKDEMNAIYNALHDHGYGENSFTSNISVNWKVDSESFNMELSLFAMNIISVNNVRYVIQYWEPGNLRQYPRQSGFVEEPIVIGIKFKINF